MENKHEIRIKAFGQIAEKIGVAELLLCDLTDTGGLLERLYADYPALRESSFALAINRRLVQGVVDLPAGCEVALLPPFSGG